MFASPSPTRTMLQGLGNRSLGSYGDNNGLNYLILGENLFFGASS